VIHNTAKSNSTVEDDLSKGAYSKSTRMHELSEEEKPSQPKENFSEFQMTKVALQ
jgi:hypothetical protein